MLDERGLIVSVLDLAAGREVLAAGRAATCCSCTRTPRTTGTPGTSTRTTAARSPTCSTRTSVDVVDRRRPAVVRRVDRRPRRVEQRIRLARGAGAVEIDTEVDWHERQKLLKLAFPLDVHADRSALRDPVRARVPADPHQHSWDAARFEICAHRWIHVGEPGYGVALANDSHLRPRRHPLRAPAAARHDRAAVAAARARCSRTRTPTRAARVAGYASLPGRGDRRRRRARATHSTCRRARRRARRRRAAGRASTTRRVVEAVKLAEDGCGDVVVRLYESLGGRARAYAHAVLPTSAAVRWTCMERTSRRPGSRRRARRPWRSRCARSRSSPCA